MAWFDVWYAEEYFIKKDLKMRMFSCLKTSLRKWQSWKSFATCYFNFFFVRFVSLWFFSFLLFGFSLCDVSQTSVRILTNKRVMKATTTTTTTAKIIKKTEKKKKKEKRKKSQKDITTQTQFFVLRKFSTGATWRSDTKAHC